METELEIVLKFTDDTTEKIVFGPYEPTAKPVSEFKANVMMTNYGNSSVKDDWYNRIVSENGAPLPSTQMIAEAYVTTIERQVIL